MAKKNYREKVKECSPFEHTKLVGKIEEVFWLAGCGENVVRSTFTSLRNRFSFLMNYASILRSESLHMAELSDLRVFPIKCKQDHDSMDIMLMQFFTGKTVQADSPSQFARATRHRDVFTCPIGALATYLVYRFQANTEFIPGHNFPDLRDNSSWFDIKLLVELGSDDCRQMDQQCFRRELSKVFKKLGIVSDHVTHWCRHTAPSHCEFKELSPDFVKQLGTTSIFVFLVQSLTAIVLSLFLLYFTTLGNWERDTQESRYSAKVPISAIRCMAGFEVADGYWLPRGNVTIPEEVESLVWPWIDSAEDFVLGYVDDEGNQEDEDDLRRAEHPTAIEFLRMLKFLRKVFLQDMAAMIVLLQSSNDSRAEKRLSHDLFSRFPLFSAASFSEFTETMRLHLQKVNDVNNEPSVALLDRFLPGINRRFDQVSDGVIKLERSMEDVHSQIQDGVLSSAENFHQLELRLTENAKRRQIQLTSTLGSFFSRGVSERATEMEEFVINNTTNTSTTNNEYTTVSPFGQSTSPNVATPNDSPPALMTEMYSPQETDATTSPTNRTNPDDNDQDDNNNEEEDEFILVSNKILSCRFIGNNRMLSLSDIYKEFFGLDIYEGVPITGGFFGLEQKYKSKWRTGYSAADKNFFSRVHALLRGVAAKAGVDVGMWNNAVENQCTAWDELVKSKGVAGTLRFLQSNGEICKKGKRKRSEN